LLRNRRWLAAGRTTGKAGAAAANTAEGNARLAVSKEVF